MDGAEAKGEAMQAGKLTNLAVRRQTKPGRYADGGNLYLLVKPSGTRTWTFRYKMAGSSGREMSLGSEADVTLAEARDLARNARRELDTGRDPIEAREQARREAAGSGMTFRDVATLYVASHEDAWRNAKHRAQWTSTLKTYAAPTLGKMPVGKVTVGHVMRVLEPMWKAKPETASRLRGRIEAVLDYATARGWRQGENPARWKGHLSNLLPKRTKIAAVRHHAALPWGECPAFMQALAGQNGAAALALRFTILTAARTSEVTGATWAEVDLQAKLWTVPGVRMKAGVEHRVPLSLAALAVLAALRIPDAKPSDYVFPGGKPGGGLSNMAMTALLRRMKRSDLTVHGFRSTFRDWAAETNPAPREVAETALAHTLRDKVEAAYRRSDLLERRAKLMADWAAFLSRPAKAGAVVPMHERRQAMA